jgi:sugar transferase EpsL
MPRSIDLLLLIIALPLLIPVFVIVALLVRLRLGRPIFFRQQRGGLHGRVIELVKFRSMTDARDAAGTLLPDAQRLTPFGRFLRASSLDELPSLLFNLAKGEIRLVGPRPFIADYLPLYTAEQRRRHDVTPGITGWAQIKGRNALSWDEKFALDLWYVDHRSTWLDLKILALTVGKVLSSQGIASEGEATMPRFAGSAGADRAKEIEP